MSFFGKVCPLLLFLVLSSCVSSKLIEKKEYEPVTKAFTQESYQKSIDIFPKKESGHFITSLEKAYLSLFLDERIQNQEINKLIQLSKDIESKDIIFVSNELQNLFYVETDEGYFPAEHEIYWMHLILGLHFIKKSDIQNARIHAQKISELFSRINLKGDKYFDDPSLRVLAASLWIAIGEWDRAQVDLRRALELNPKLPFRKMLSQSEPPEVWNLIFRGPGYRPQFDSDKLENKFRGSQGITFASSLGAFEAPESYYLLGNTSKWYERHLARNQDIKEIIDKSKYMSRMLKSEIESTSLRFLTTAVTGAVVTTAAVLGIGIIGGGIYLLSQVKDSSADAVGYIFGIGILVSTELYNEGMKFYKSSMTSIDEEKKNFQDVSRFYRFVRFIPDEFYLSHTTVSNKSWFPFIETKSQKTKVQFYFLRD